MWTIPDDPIISCIERTGYPPWMQDDWEDDEEEEEVDADDQEEQTTDA